MIALKIVFLLYFTYFYLDKVFSQCILIIFIISKVCFPVEIESNHFWIWRGALAESLATIAIHFLAVRVQRVRQFLISNLLEDTIMRIQLAKLGIPLHKCVGKLVWVEDGVLHWECRSVWQGHVQYIKAFLIINLPIVVEN